MLSGRCLVLTRRINALHLRSGQRLSAKQDEAAERRDTTARLRAAAQTASTENT
jgi:hypothetical protein